MVNIVKSINRLKQIRFIINVAIDLFQLWAFGEFRSET